MNIVIIFHFWYQFYLFSIVGTEQTSFIFLSYKFLLTIVTMLNTQQRHKHVQCDFVVSLGSLSNWTRAQPAHHSVSIIIEVVLAVSIKTRLGQLGQFSGKKNCSLQRSAYHCSGFLRSNRFLFVVKIKTFWSAIKFREFHFRFYF